VELFRSLWCTGSGEGENKVFRGNTSEYVLQRLPIAPKEKGMTEDEMAGWHHRLNGHEFE